MKRATEYMNLFIKKVLLSLWYANRVIRTRLERPTKGLRYGDLRSCLNTLFAEGLSPDVTLFSFHRKQYVSVSFFDFLFYPFGLINPGSEVPLSTWSVINRIRMVLTDGIKIGSIVSLRDI